MSSHSVTSSAEYIVGLVCISALIVVKSFLCWIKAFTEPAIESLKLLSLDSLSLYSFCSSIVKAIDTPMLEF